MVVATCQEKCRHHNKHNAEAKRQQLEETSFFAHNFYLYNFIYSLYRNSQYINENILLVGYFDFAHKRFTFLVSQWRVLKLWYLSKTDAFLVRYGDGLVQDLHLLPQINKKIIPPIKAFCKQNRWYFLMDFTIRNIRYGRSYMVYKVRFIIVIHIT